MTRTMSKENDPIVMGPVRAKPEDLNTWDKVLVNKGDLTLGQVNKNRVTCSLVLSLP